MVKVNVEVSQGGSLGAMGCEGYEQYKYPYKSSNEFDSSR